MSFSLPDTAKPPAWTAPAAGAMLIAIVAAGCNTRPGSAHPLFADCNTNGVADDPAESDVIASVINVTPYEISVLLSGILGDAVDTVERTVETKGSTDVQFACVDELVVGDPLEPERAGVIIQDGDDPATIEPFRLIGGDTFVCGDIVEIIVSGNDLDTFVVDVFALTPPDVRR